MKAEEISALVEARNSQGPFRPLADTIVSIDFTPFEWSMSYDRFFMGVTIGFGPFCFHCALPTCIKEPRALRDAGRGE